MSARDMLLRMVSPVHQTRTFRRAGDVDLCVDAYVPDGEATRGVLVWLHGGALVLGGRQDVSAEVLDIVVRGTTSWWCRLTIDSHPR